MGLCRLLEKGTDGWEYGEQAARAAAAKAPPEHSFAAEGKHQIPGRGTVSCGPLEGGQMPESCPPGQFPGPLEIPPYILRPVGV